MAHPRSGRVCRLGGRWAPVGGWVLGVAVWLVVGAAASLVIGRVLWLRSQALEPGRPAESNGRPRQGAPVRLWWVLQVHRRRRQGRLARQMPPGEL